MYCFSELWTVAATSYLWDVAPLLMKETHIWAVFSATSLLDQRLEGRVATTLNNIKMEHTARNINAKPKELYAECQRVIQASCQLHFVAPAGYVRLGETSADRPSLGRHLMRREVAIGVHLRKGVSGA